MLGPSLPKSGGLRSSSTSSEAKGREVPHVSGSENGPDRDPGRARFPLSTGSVTRALRLVAAFVLQVVVVAGIRKVLDWLIP
ncbi:MAG: hypothetical protein ACO363_08210 [Balneolaceae bacterium]